MLALLNVTSFVASSGYAAVFILSVLQSCCIPTSSELTLGFAGVLAAEGKLSLAGVILAGTIGEVVGAYIAWAVGRWGGRPFVERYGRYVLMTSQDLDRAEAWYGRHERFGVFGSRLLPVIRNFVALPAGVAEVPLARFGVLTAAGSLIWDGAMALIGYGIGHSYTKVMKGFSDAGYLLGAAAAVAIAFVVWHRWQSYKRVTRGAGPGPAHARPRSRPSGTSRATTTPSSSPSSSSAPAGRPPAVHPADQGHGERRPARPSSVLPLPEPYLSYEPD